VPQPFPERDRFAGAVEARVAARLRAAGERLRRQAEENGWDVLVADGDPRLLGELESGLELVPSIRSLAGVPAGDVAARVAETLERVRGERTERLLARLATPAATTDPGAVARALDEGRVEHLFLAAGDDGEAHARERLLRHALETAAEVTVLDPAPEHLGEGGVAALLRW
jgi:hypothetical protein